MIREKTPATCRWWSPLVEPAPPPPAGHVQPALGERATCLGGTGPGPRPPSAASPARADRDQSAPSASQWFLETHDQLSRAERGSWDPQTSQHQKVCALPAPAGAGHILNEPRVATIHADHPDTSGRRHRAGEADPAGQQPLPASQHLLTTTRRIRSWSTIDSASAALKMPPLPSTGVPKAASPLSPAIVSDRPALSTAASGFRPCRATRSSARAAVRLADRGQGD